MIQDKEVITTDRARVCPNRNCFGSEECVLHMTHHHFKVSECAHGERGHTPCSFLNEVVPTNICPQEKCPQFDKCTDLSW